MKILDKILMSTGILVLLVFIAYLENEKRELSQEIERLEQQRAIVDVMGQDLLCDCRITHLDGLAIYRDADTNEVIGTWKQ